MDSSQITGASSSYARKYALNGLFAIDDTKDKDTNEAAKEEAEREKESTKTEEQERQDAIEEFKAEALKRGFTEEEQQLLILKSFKGKKVSEMTLKQAQTITNKVINDSEKTREFIDGCKEVS